MIYTPARVKVAVATPALNRILAVLPLGADRVDHVIDGCDDIAFPYRSKHLSSTACVVALVTSGFELSTTVPSEVLNATEVMSCDALKETVATCAPALAFSVYIPALLTTVARLLPLAVSVAEPPTGAATALQVISVELTKAD